MVSEMDTRNRWQRIYEAKYDNKPISIDRKRLSETNIDKFNRLSDNYGHTLRHPRTREIIRMKSSDVMPPKTMPRTYRKVAQPIQYIRTTKTKDGKLETEIYTGRNKRKSWKSIWYSGHNRRK